LDPFASLFECEFLRSVLQTLRLPVSGILLIPSVRIGKVGVFADLGMSGFIDLFKAIGC
jgi:hypothetical protein